MFRILLVFVMVSGSSGLVRPQSVTAGQAQSDPASGTEKLIVENVQFWVELDHVRLSFLVRDGEGNFIRNLSSEDFVLFENGQPRAISALQEREVPISVSLLVDTSWSMGAFLQDALSTAAGFFRNLEGEQSSIVLFSEEPRVLADWGSAPLDLAADLSAARTNGKTRIHDSVIWAVKNLFPEVTGKKVIILITDGIDTTSRASFKQMMRATREAGITLYPVIYSNSSMAEYRKKLSDHRARGGAPVSTAFHSFMLAQSEFLRESQRLGGRTIFSNGFTDLAEVYGEIIREMRSHYVLLYQPGAELEGKREVRIDTRRLPARIFIEVGS